MDKREILESVAISSVTPLVKFVSRPLLHLRPIRFTEDTAAVVSWLRRLCCCSSGPRTEAGAPNSSIWDTSNLKNAFCEEKSRLHWAWSLGLRNFYWTSFSLSKTFPRGLFDSPSVQFSEPPSWRWFSLPRCPPGVVSPPHTSSASPGGLTLQPLFHFEDLMQMHSPSWKPLDPWSNHLRLKQHPPISWC